MSEVEIQKLIVRSSLQTMEQLYQTFPHLKEKLEAQLAKIPADRREWFVRNQAAIIAKLHQQRHLQSATTPVTVTLSICLVCITLHCVMRHWICKPACLVPVPSQDKVGGLQWEGHPA